MEEQRPEEPCVDSSKLSRGIIWVRGATGAQLLCKQKVEGSSPFGSTHLYQNRHLIKDRFKDKKGDIVMDSDYYYYHSKYYKTGE